MFRFLRGPALIAAVIRSFEKLIVHIERGIQHVDGEIVQRTTRITELEAEVRELAAHRDRGTNFAAKLRNLVG